MAPLPWLVTPALAGDGGRLPRGDEALPGGSPAPKSEPPRASPKVAVPKTVASKRNCFLDLSQPPGGNGLFSADGNALYLLAQTSYKEGDKKGKGTKGKDPGKAQYALLKIDPRTRIATRVAGFDQGPNASLVAAGDGLQAAAAVAYSGMTAGCFTGPAEVQTLSFTQEKPRLEHLSGAFDIVPTPDGRILADRDKGIIVSQDPNTFQTKKLRKAPPGERLLFYDVARNYLVDWVDAAGTRGLVAYTGGLAGSGAGASTRHLAVSEGDRVLQNDGHFALLHLDQSKNTLEIEELPTWTGSGPGTRYKLQIPPIYPVATAGVDVHFKKRLAVVTGANLIGKQKWQRVFVFDYATGKMLGALPLTGTQYPYFAGLDPTGSVAVVEVRDTMTRLTTAVSVFTVAKKAFEDVALPPKPE